MRFGWIGEGLGSAEPVGLNVKLRPKSFRFIIGSWHDPIASWQRYPVQGLGPTIKRVYLKWFTGVGLVPESVLLKRA